MTHSEWQLHCQNRHAASWNFGTGVAFAAGPSLSAMPTAGDRMPSNRAANPMAILTRIFPPYITGNMLAERPVFAKLAGTHKTGGSRLPFSRWFVMAGLAANFRQAAQVCLPGHPRLEASKAWMPGHTSRL
jgi:hypothetical protein